MAIDGPDQDISRTTGSARPRPRRTTRTSASRMALLVSAMVGPFPTCRSIGPARCPTGATACPLGSMGCRAAPGVPLGCAPAFDQSAIGAEAAALGAIAGPRELSPLVLRYFLTLTMVDGGREMSVRELGERLRGAGCAVAGRTSKVISDSLRWEVRRGRVRRVGRGRYVADRIPRQTLAWMRNRLAEELKAPPRPVRAWPVSGFRAGWNAQRRGRELAAERAARADRGRSARRLAFALWWRDRRRDRVPLTSDPTELTARITAGELAGWEPEHVDVEDDRSVEEERGGARRCAVTAAGASAALGSLGP